MLTCPDDDALARYRNGETSELAGHVATCELCRNLLETMTTTSRRLHRAR